jgi:hypothetical protein
MSPDRGLAAFVRRACAGAASRVRELPPPCTSVTGAVAGTGAIVGGATISIAITGAVDAISPAGRSNESTSAPSTPCTATETSSAFTFRVSQTRWTDAPRRC